MFRRSCYRCGEKVGSLPALVGVLVATGRLRVVGGASSDGRLGAVGGGSVRRLGSRGVRGKDGGGGLVVGDCDAGGVVALSDGPGLGLALVADRRLRGSNRHGDWLSNDGLGDGDGSRAGGVSRRGRWCWRDDRRVDNGSREDDGGRKGLVGGVGLGHSRASEIGRVDDRVTIVADGGRAGDEDVGDGGDGLGSRCWRCGRCWWRSGLVASALARGDGDR